MDRLWSNVARGTKSDSSKATNPAEVVMDPREGDPLPKTMPEGLTLGSLVPDFIAESTQGKVEWHRWIGDSWALLLSYPQDFYPVSTTELAHLAKMRKEFEHRNVKVAVVSGNTVDDHHEWVHDIESSELPDGHPIGFAMMSDPDRSIAESYGMLDPKERTPNGLPVMCRAAFVIGPDKRLKLSMLYPTTTGRNLSEILRAIDSMQIKEKHGVMTPANWAPGDKCVIDPTIPDPEASERFGNVTSLSMNSGRVYMRYVNDPSGLAKKSFSWGGFLKMLLGVTSGFMISAIGGKLHKQMKEKSDSSN